MNESDNAMVFTAAFDLRNASEMDSFIDCLVEELKYNLKSKIVKCPGEYYLRLSMDKFTHRNA